MKMGLEPTLQTNQQLSQIQIQSVNILAMSMTELHDFLQNEEIENPLIEYTMDENRREFTFTAGENRKSFTDSEERERGEWDLFKMDDNREKSAENLVKTQLRQEHLDERRRKVVDFCIHSLDQNGYLTVSAEEISQTLHMETEIVEEVLSELKTLEPKGLFASGLEECLLLQIEGFEQEKELREIIQNHLKDVAEGRISNISRQMSLTTTEVKKLVLIIKNLNPRPLNGYGTEQTHYIVPDIIFEYQEGQWNIRLNDGPMRNLHISDFYLRMMETAQDETLKSYFEEKRKRAQAVVNAVEQRKRTLMGLAAGILKRQSGYLLGREALNPMTMEELAQEQGLHKSTVSRAMKDKYLLAPSGCVRMRDLFTRGLPSAEGSEELSRNTIKYRIKSLVEHENRKAPYSDQQLMEILEMEGIKISRRTVAKYRTELGIRNARARQYG